MWAYLSYWIDNITVGWEIGGGIFEKVDLITLIISVGLLGWKKTRKYHKHWNGLEEFIMMCAFHVLWVSFVFSTFCVAPFLHHKNQDEKLLAAEKRNENLQKQIEDKSPKLIGQAVQYMHGSAIDFQTREFTCNWMVEMSIKNLGAPSIAENFKMQIWTNKNSTEKPFEAFPQMWDLSAGTNFWIYAEGSGERFHFSLADMLFEKTITAIPQGQKIVGWISFDFKDTNICSAKAEDLKIVISFDDVEGNRSFLTNIDMNAYSGILHYTPGSRYPELPMKRTQQTN